MCPEQRPHICQLQANVVHGICGRPARFSFFREEEDFLFADLPPFPSRNRRLDLDGADFSHGVVTIAAPEPVFRSRDQVAMDGIAVDVLEFLDALLGSPDVEVVITGLPEASVVTVESLGDGLLQRLDCAGESGPFGLSDEQVNVLGHDHISDHMEAVAATGLFERALEGFFGVRCVEEGLPTITAKGDEVEISALLETDKPPRHGERLRVVV